jgi:hypothetical protein
VKSGRNISSRGIRMSLALRQALIYSWDREAVVCKHGKNKVGFVGSGWIVEGLPTEEISFLPADDCWCG